MRNYRIKIELLSDMCVSDGGIYNSAIDTDICYDEYGFPYIPAKRLKGCLRECALELKDWGMQIGVQEMFGTQGNDDSDSEKAGKAGAVHIRDAYIANRERFVSEIRQNQSVSPVLCHPQNILKVFSYVRVQTSIDYETGVAQEQSLRTMRVANKGQVFYAAVEMDEKYEKELKNCLAVLKHMGIARTRGFGEIKATLEVQAEKNNPAKCAAYQQNADYLEYEIRLLSPVICKSVHGQEESSMDYIEGAKVLGHILHRITGAEQKEKFLTALSDNKLIFGNAYLSHKGERLTEVPAAFYGIKNDKVHFRNKIYETKEIRAKEKNAENPVQLNQIKHCYVCMPQDGRLQKYDVEMEERYHHSRPEDKSIGRAVDSTLSKFYQISSIKAGQTFKGFISGEPEFIREIYELLKKSSQASFGYARNAEYGNCEITVTKTAVQKKPEMQSVKKFYLKLNAPLILYSEKVMYTTDAKELVKELSAALWQNENILENSVESRYIKTTFVGGYNVTWGLRKPTVGAFDKGTVIQFKAENAVDIPVGTIWLGERNTEGYGECELAVCEEGAYYGEYVQETLSAVKGQDTAGRIKICTELLGKVADNLFDEYLHAYAAHKAKDHEREYGSYSKATVSNMQIMCSENDSLEKVKNICEERYNKASDEKKKKLEQAKKICETVERDSKDIKDKFMEQYHLSDFEYKDNENIEMIYLRQYLIQLKYRLRQKEGVPDEQ